METFVVPPLIGQQIMEIMGFDGLSIQSPDNYRRYLDVAQYLGKFEDGIQIARIVTRGAKPDERASKLAEYVNLRKQLENVRGKLKELPSENLVTSENLEVKQQREQYQMQESSILNEIAYYE